MSFHTMLCVSTWIISGATKFGLLCELYTRNKKEMSKPERQEALDYLRGRYTLGVRGCAAPMHCSVSSHPLTPHT